MKKLSSFLVDKRKIIVIAMLIISVICLLLISHVVVNKDMTKYLSKESRMKQGLDVMTDEFPGMSMSVDLVQVMFTGLEKDKATQVSEYLSQIEGVESVAYDPDSEDYNKDNYTLFNITPAKGANQESISDAITSKYGESVVVETSDSGSLVTPQLLLIAFGILMTILFLMCESWLEPFLFLATIGVAILLNTGTNAVFPYVSDITNSIAAILQLVLSMDYSIILMNRYRQEKATASDKYEAMKSAIANGSSSILSSAFTTVVGLLCLVFMKFKIGADMGLILAKGVICSLICIFTVLPSLILVFDAKIEKLHKKVLKIPTGALSKFSNKLRVPLLIAFVVLFGVSFFLSKKTAITFSIPEDSKIHEIFPSANSTVILYNNKDADKIISLAEEIEKDEHIKSIYSYPTLLQKEYTPDEMYDSINSMTALMPAGTDSSMLDMMNADMIRLIYTLSAGNGGSEELTVSEFVSFLASQAKTNKLFSANMDSEMINQLDTFKKLTDKDTLHKKISAAEMASLFSISKSTVSMVYSLYNQINGKDEKAMSPLQFIDFIDEIAGDPSSSSGLSAYADYIPIIADVLDGVSKGKKYTSEEIAKILYDLGAGDKVNKNTVDMIFLYYDINKGNNLVTSRTKSMELGEFIRFAKSQLENSEIFSEKLDSNTLRLLDIAENITDKKNVDKKMTPSELAKLIGIDEDLISGLFEIYSETNGEKVEKLSPLELIHFANDVLSSPEGMSSLFGNYTDQISALKTITRYVENGTPLSAEKMAKLFSKLSEDFGESEINLIYLFYSAVNDFDPTLKMSFEQILDYVSTDLVNDSRFDAFLDDDTKKSLSSAKEMLSSNMGSLVGKNYSIMAITSSYSDESEETMNYIIKLRKLAGENLSSDYYLIGSSVMYRELQESFSEEMRNVTILTVLAIFIIVAITFKSVFIPAILVLMVMCAVYIDVSFSGITGNSIVYLAYLIVQSILMGATIDYGILYTNYYRENRKTMDVLEAIKESYNGSVHTILTSGLIMVTVTGVLGNYFKDPSVAMIVKSLSIGSASAILLIMLVLPGTLAALDKFVKKKEK